MIELKQNIKIYKIDRAFYELRELNTPEAKIRYIIRKHKEKNKNIKNPKKNIASYKKDNLKYHLYVFSQPQQQAVWKNYLPIELTEKESFLIQQTSFVLFIENGLDIFVIIGGCGIQVVRRFLNQTFGLDILARIAKPELDKVHSTKLRGMAGNIAANSSFFRNEHKLIDTMRFASIHTEVNFEFRTEIISSIFDFLDVKKNNSLNGFAGTAFSIKTKLTFEQVHELIKKIIFIEDKIKLKPLSCFVQITDSMRIERELYPQLYDYLREDLINIFESKQKRISSFKFEFDFCHPSKMAEFYECDKYEILERNARKPFLEQESKNDIYKNIMEYVHKNGKHNKIYDFMSFLGGVKIKGFKGGTVKTTAPFIKHISCEILIDKKSFFCIDTKWYRLRGEFIEDINKTCAKLILNNLVSFPILSKKWINYKSLSEGEYNQFYENEENYIVLDKVLSDNIELCDIMYEMDNKLYLIHVKKGFNAKIRDLINQILISSKRLWAALKSSDTLFLDTIYNKSKEKHNKSREFFFKLFDKEIIYVLAFVSTKDDNKKIIDDISKSNSNIAKFSMITCIREMKESSYPLKVVEIER